jgi:hypothetical protein
VRRLGDFFRNLGAFIRSYGTAISLIILGMVLLIFLLNVSAQQIEAIKSLGPEAEGLWNTLSDILVVIASGFLSIGGMAIGNTVQNQHLKEQEIREIRRRITGEYREYLTWLLQIGQHAEFIKKAPKLRERLPGKGHQFDITPELRAGIIERMPLAWELSSADDADLQKAVSNAIDVALEYLSVVSDGNGGQPEYEKVKNSYNIAMKTLDKFEIRS